MLFLLIQKGKKAYVFFSIHVYTISTYPERKKKHALEIIQQFLWLPETSQSFLIINTALFCEIYY